MSPLQKNIALWLVISLVFIMLYHLFNQPRSTREDIIFSDFLDYINKGQVAEVTIQGENVFGTFTGGKGFKTFAPKDSGLVPVSVFPATFPAGSAAVRVAFGAAALIPGVAATVTGTAVALAGIVVAVTVTPGSVLFAEAFAAAVSARAGQTAKNSVANTMPARHA